MRVMSYNIHRGVGSRDGKYQPQRVIDVIEAHNPDIICLQEVALKTKQVRHEDQPAMFREALRFEHVVFQGNRHLKEGVWGNMLLSRWPIARSHRISLTWQWRKARGAILSDIETTEGRLHIVNWHLGLSARERLWQVRHLLKHPLYCESAHLPTLIIGDSNDWRNRLWIDEFSSGEWELHTRPASRFRTYPSTFPVGALDKAYCLGKITVKHCSIVHDKLARVASDHLPLLVDLHLTSPAEENGVPESESAVEATP
jgi:endonuclease/exonuclease/phosphatase family metal-dependent hydrolase